MYFTAFKPLMCCLTCLTGCFRTECPSAPQSSTVGPKEGCLQVEEDPEEGSCPKEAAHLAASCLAAGHQVEVDHQGEVPVSVAASQRQPSSAAFTAPAED